MTSETCNNRPLCAQRLAFFRARLGLLISLAGAIVAASAASCVAADKSPAGDKGPLSGASGQTPLTLDGRDGRELALDQFRPRPMLKVSEHLLTHARLPVVDVHVHPRVRLRDSIKELDEFVKLMDQHNIAVCVSLDGQLGESLDQHMKYLWTRHRSRFVIFANVDWRGSGKIDEPATWDCQRPDFGRRMAEQLAAAKKAGASGLKVFKDLGLVYRNPDGSLIKADDPRWDPIWEACGQLGFPVLIHTADPAAFFLPIDQSNERWEELRRHPDWSFDKPGYPSYAELVEQLEHIVARHPETTFIGAHMANQAEDLATARPMARQVSESERRHFRPDRRARPATCHGPQIHHQVCRPGVVRHRRPAQSRSG